MPAFRFVDVSGRRLDEPSEYRVAAAAGGVSACGVAACARSHEQLHGRRRIAERLAFSSAPRPTCRRRRTSPRCMADDCESDRALQTRGARSRHIADLDTRLRVELHVPMLAPGTRGTLICRMSRSPCESPPVIHQIVVSSRGGSQRCRPHSHGTHSVARAAAGSAASDLAGLRTGCERRVRSTIASGKQPHIQNARAVDTLVSAEADRCPPKRSPDRARRHKKKVRLLVA